MLAAICCQGGNTVSIVDLETYESRGAIAVGRHPVHAAVAQGRLFVATMDERAVSVVDTDGSVQRLNTGVLGPSHFAKAGGRLFVTCTGGDVVVAIDPDGPDILGRIYAGTEPHAITASDEAVFVGSRVDGTVTGIDPGTLEILGTVGVGPETRLQDLVSYDHDSVYGTDQTNARVIRFALEGVRAKASVGANPNELIVTDDAVIVPGRGDGTVHVLNHDFTDATVYEMGSNPVDVTLLAGQHWVASRGEANLRSLEGEVIGLPFPAFRFVPVNKTRLLCGHFDDAAVSVVDVSEYRVHATVAVDSHPLGMLVI